MPKKKSKKGFASPNFDPELKRKIQSKGGKLSKGGGRPRKVTDESKQLDRESLERAIANEKF